MQHCWSSDGPVKPYGRSTLPLVRVETGFLPLVMTWSDLGVAQSVIALPHLAAEQPVHCPGVDRDHRQNE